MQWARVLLIAVPGICVAAENSATLAQYVDCAEAMQVSLRLKPGVVLAPAFRREKGGLKKGFYVYTKSTAQFYPLGVAREWNETYKYHYFRLSLSGSPDMSFTYSDPQNHSTADVALGLDLQPKLNLSLYDKYVKIGGNDTLDDAARSALSATLQSSVRNVLKEYLQNVSNAKMEHAPAPEKARFEKVLAACSFDGDRALHAAVLAESQKLQKTNPDWAQPAQAQQNSVNSAHVR